MRFLKNLSLVMMPSWRHKPPYDTHTEALINRASLMLIPLAVPEELKHMHRQTELGFMV